MAEPGLSTIGPPTRTPPLTTERRRPVIDARQAVSGTLWAYLAFVVGKAMIFASTVVLARLLLPADFGIMAYCLTGLSYLLVFQSFGVETALISRRDQVEAAANAAFVTSLATGLTLYAMAWLAAPSIADFFHEPPLTDFFRTLALALPITSVMAVPNALLQRRLRFRDRMVAELAQASVKTILTIGLAWQGMGVWSLVLGHLAGEIIIALTYWLLAGWWPSLHFNRTVTRETITFGGHIIIVGLLGVLINTIDYLLVGRLLGATALGLYTLAYRIPELVIMNTNVVIGTVALPLFSRSQSDLRQLRALLLTYVRYVSLFAFPAGVGLAVVAPIFVDIIYSARWAEAALPMQCVSIALAINAIAYLPGHVYKAVNRPAILSQIGLLKLPLIIGMLWLGTQWGIVGVAIAQIGVALLNLLFESIVVSSLIRCQARDLVAALRPAFVASSAMGGVATLVVVLVDQMGLTALALAIGIGAAVYLVTLWVIDRPTMQHLVGMLRGYLARRA